MRILHYSDNHGAMIHFKGKYDIVVNSGDFAMDYNIPFTQRKFYQTEWLKKVAPHLKASLHNTPFLYTLGNHDFQDPWEMEDILRSNGIDAHCLHDKVVSHSGVNFYGFPYIPPITGSWQYERTVDEMKELIAPLKEAISNYQVDVIVAHAPPHGILDEDQHYGNSVMTNMLMYEVLAENVPGYMFVGHCHRSYGIMKLGDMLVVNSATTSNIIEI